MHLIVCCANAPGAWAKSVTAKSAKAAQSPQRKSDGKTDSSSSRALLKIFAPFAVRVAPLNPCRSVLFGVPCSIYLVVYSNVHGETFSCSYSCFPSTYLPSPSPHNLAASCSSSSREMQPSPKSLRVGVSLCKSGHTGALDAVLYDPEKILRWQFLC